MLSLALVSLLSPPTDLVYVRHAETLANAGHGYRSSTIDTFSPKGRRQVQELTQRLSGVPRFDRIYVSPSPRAMRTIAPYLRASGQKAVVWPLLYECCTGKRTTSTPSRFQYGAKITIPADLASVIQVRPGWDRFPVSPTYSSGLGQVDAAVTQFRSQLTGGRILLVGHSGMGGQFLHRLTGRWRKVENAKEIEISIPGNRNRMDP